MKAFYAHPKSAYDSEQEGEDVGIMGMMGINVMNPNCPEVQTRIQIMRDCGQTEAEVEAFVLSQIDKCDAVIFRSLKSGIPPEVWAAIEKAKVDRKPVLEVPWLENRDVSG